MRAVDLFAGPGGWDEGVRDLGINPCGIEWDTAACETRRARGHYTVQADVSELQPLSYFPCDLLIASPPCQAFSAAGKGDGNKDVPLIMEAARALGRGEDIRAELTSRLADSRSLLVVEPLRWALALRPAYIACEQVPPVLPLWQAFAEILRTHGYNAWAGVLSAERYGVPQTRERAFLIAGRGQVRPPAPTHQGYVYGEPAAQQHTIEGNLEPWVSMAEALDQPTVHFGHALNNVSWVARRPAPTIVTTRRSKDGLLVGRQMAEGEGENVGGWGYERPATTIAGDSRVFQPGGHHEPGKQSQNAVRVTVRGASILQGFPADYPWQGSHTKQFEQIGNAVPPPLARAVIAALLGDALEEAA